jgi:hypothetical protein
MFGLGRESVPRLTASFFFPPRAGPKMLLFIPLHARTAKTISLENSIGLSHLNPRIFFSQALRLR